MELSGELWSALERERAYWKVRAQRERMIDDTGCQGNFETGMPNMNCVYSQLFITSASDSALVLAMAWGREDVCVCN